MGQKRSFVEDLCEISCKYPRHLGHSRHIVSFSELPYEDKAFKLHTSGDLNDHCNKSGNGNNLTVFPQSTKEDFEITLPGCNSNTSWVRSSITDEDMRLEMPFHLLFSPERFNYDIPRRTVCHREDAYSYSLFDHPRKKQVSVGPDFQAVIPEWSPRGVENRSYCSDFAGTCVVPMPEVETTTCVNDKVGVSRTNCCCEDWGSVRCVRQHVTESRENLLKSLGEERFLELGFNEMGEVVAERWSEEDEQLFHEVVFSNPISSGKNFWDHLSVMFPSRSKKEIVSYYFNVFMLRRRAEQNRCNTMDIDSDNDAWQGSDDEGEISEEEDEDSIAGSPVYQDDLDLNEINEDDNSHEYDEGEWHNVSDYTGSDPVFEKIHLDEMGDGDFNGSSCTSSDTVAAPQGSQVSADNSSRCWTGTYNGTSGGSDREFVLDGCDDKEWDMGYLSRTKNEADFLPTCNMIEEVFGVGSWDCDGRDGEGLSQYETNPPLEKHA